MKQWVVPVTTISIITGLLLAVQWRSQADARKVMPSRRLEDLVVLLKSTEKGNALLAEQVTELQSQLARGDVAPAEAPLPPPTSQDYPALEGPGLVVTVSETSTVGPGEDEASAVVHAEDLLKIVNELRTGGGEAVAVNGHRITELSEIVTAGQHIVINQVPVRAPYVILAIGPSEDMKTTLGLRGGVAEYLQFYGIRVETRAAPRVVVPAFVGRVGGRAPQATSRSLGSRPRRRPVGRD
ncbi:MAG: DUF881 domain-containing protein [Candidatus Sericytochromatia bacterium]|nr:DUF881 domain-containing protein [Candidatus Sericytochromatia bacterium]